MQRSSLLALALVVAALVAATPAAAQSTAAPPPTTYTSPQLMPSALETPAEYVFGSDVDQVPPGTTALVWSLTLVEGQAISLTMACPAGQVMTDLNITGPATGSGEPGDMGPFTAWYGKNAPTVTIPTVKPGPLVWAVICLPQAQATTTVLRGRSPVSFPATMSTPAVRRGAQLPKGATVLKSVTTSPLNAGGTWVTTTRGCPAGVNASMVVPTSPGSGGTGTSASPTSLLLYPSSTLGTGPVSAYVLCAHPEKPLSR